MINQHETACGGLLKLLIDRAVKWAIVVRLKVEMWPVKGSRNLPFQKKEKLLHLDGRIAVATPRSHRSQYKFFSGHVCSQVYTRPIWPKYPSK